MIGMSEKQRSPSERRRQMRRFVHLPTGNCIATHVRLANTFLTRFRGLMLRRGLEPGEGLLLRPCQSIHTFWMLFPIDVIFLDRELQIVKLVENLRPFRLTSPQFAAHSVLELRSGTIARFGMKVGDRLRIDSES